MNYSGLTGRFNTAGITEKLIMINVGVFAVFVILKVVAFLFQSDSLVDVIQDWLIVPSDLGKLVERPWVIFSYAFMHAGFWHILANMILLYFSGRFFLTLFTPKRLLNYYLLGGVAGALFFLLSYNLFPVFQEATNSRLLGASASVMAILVGIATSAPQMGIRIFMFTLKLWWIAVFFVVKDLVSIPLDNPGGHIAHLGGAALGFLYSKQLKRGKNIGLWFERFMDKLVGLFTLKPKTPFKKVYKNKKKPMAKRGAYDSNQPETDKQKKIDAILDKISKNGYDSLTKEEKEFLFSVSKD